MKKVNLIQTLTSQEHTKIARWLFWSILFFSATLMIIAWFTVPQLLALSSAKKEVIALRKKTKEYTTVIENKNRLAKQQQNLHQQKTKMEHFLSKPKNPYDHLKQLNSACGDGINLQTCTINKKNLELTASCPTPEHATIFIQRLSATQNFSHVHLVSLSQENNNQFAITVKGKTI